MFERSGGTVLPEASKYVSRLGAEDDASNIAVWVAWSCRKNAHRISSVLRDPHLRRIFYRALRKSFESEASKPSLDPTPGNVTV